MYSYSVQSQDRLATCHQDLRVVFKTALKWYDHTIICGHRTEAAQNEAYRTGHSKIPWPESKHNKSPSLAVDAGPYPLDWNDREAFTLFAGYILAIGDMLYSLGITQHRIRWGGDWDRDRDLKDNNFDDLSHFELYKPE